MRRPLPEDAGSTDAATLDSELIDLGVERDLGSADLGSRDLGATDLGASDLGSPDLGRDAGLPDLGRDLGVVDLGRDAGTTTGTTFSFPNVGDTWTDSSEYLWSAGTSVQGVRSVGLATVGRASISAVITSNSLDCDGQDMRLLVDGHLAGTFTINSGDTLITRDFVFAGGAVSGGTVTLRYENAREVDSGCGSALFDHPASTVTLAP